MEVNWDEVANRIEKYGREADKIFRDPAVKPADRQSADIVRTIAMMLTSALRKGIDSK